MNTKTLKLERPQALRICSSADWNPEEAPHLTNEEHKQLREDLLKVFEKAIGSYNIEHQKYQFDVSFGIELIDYFESIPWFSLRLASNDDFWAFLSIKIVPDLVFRRYENSYDHYFWFKHRNRIYLKAIWWYVTLSWQGDKNKTLKTLLCPALNTDSIVAMVERPGRGMRFDLSKTLMLACSVLTEKQVSDFAAAHTIHKDGKSVSTTVFRALMKANTLASFNMEPELCEGGVHGYVASLFKDLGIDIELPNESQEAESADIIPQKPEITISSEVDNTNTPLEGQEGKRKRLRILRNASEKGISFKDANRYQKLSERLHLVKSDIVVLRVDAIVNSTNLDLAAGSGISAHIHAAAGEALAVACWRFPVCTPGHCIKTEGYNLPATHILHTVAPDCRVIDSVDSRNTKLSSCYKNIMKVAKESKFSSVAIPCLGTGYGNFPKSEAAKIALQTLQSALDTNEYGTDFVVCCFDDNDYDIYLEAWKEYCATQYPQSIANIEQNNEYKHEEQTAINVVAPTSCAEIEYSKDGTKLLKAKSIQGHFDVPQNVYWIESKAFENCTELKSITIPHSVNYIGEAAFAGCKKLEYIELPNSIRILNEKLFAHCEKLKSVVLQENLKVIRERVFYECPNLKSITIPQTVTEISEYAFTRSSIISIHCRLLLEHLGIAKISPNAFKQMLTKYALFIPRGLEKEYKKRNLFRNYTIIREE